MNSFDTLVLAAVLCYVLTYLYKLFIAPRFLQLAQVPGPPKESLIFGTLAGAQANGGWNELEKWRKAYGDTYVVDDMFGSKAIVTTDKVAINHVYHVRAFEYGMPKLFKRILEGTLGKGILTSDGEDHKNQRRVLSPAFSIAHINSLVPEFRTIALKLSGLWENALDLLPKERTDDGVEMNVHDWFARVTFDAIGQTGFGHDFRTLTAGAELSEDGLASAFRTIFYYMQGEPMAIAEAFLPILKLLPTRRRQTINQNEKYIETRCRDIVQERKRDVMALADGGAVKKEDISGRDLLSLLIKANMAEDLRDDQRMSDEKVAEQVALFMAAGHDTTSNSLAFCAWHLVDDAVCQTKLREELVSCPALDPNAAADECTYQAISELKYLDAVVNETIRLHPAGDCTMRTAMGPEVVPFSTPIKLRNGRTTTALNLRPGDKLVYPMPNKDPSIWGDDVNEFKPERWFDLPERARDEQGWNHLGTFGYGPKNCMGLRFAALEMKVVIATVVRNFVLTASPRTKDVVIRTKILPKPYLKGDDSMPHLPVMVQRYTAK